MFFSAKSKNFYIDFSEHAVLIARTSKAEAPFVVEEIVECAPGDAEALSAALKSLQTAKSASGYIHAACGINAPRRVVRKVTFETKRLKEPEYLNEVAVQQLRIEPDQYSLAVINSNVGTDYDMVKAAQKDALMCGIPTADVNVAQDNLLASGIYPETVELSSIAAIGAMVDYLAFSKIKAPVLILEIGAESTNSFIVTSAGVEASRPIQQGLEAMIPVVQKELGLKDEASARKLLLSNTFDFTGMGSVLIKRLIKELQSSIGFYEVQTGQSVAHVACVLLPSKLVWLEGAIAADLGVSVLKPDIPAWLQSQQITLADALPANAQDVRRLGLFGLMVQYKNSHAVVSEKTQ
jgi:Tfp pilus assembly PilM family ATPase